MNRRSLLCGLASAAGLVALEPIVKPVTYFLPPSGGWGVGQAAIMGMRNPLFSRETGRWHGVLLVEDLHAIAARLREMEPVPRPVFYIPSRDGWLPVSPE